MRKKAERLEGSMGEEGLLNKEEIKNNIQVNLTGAQIFAGFASFFIVAAAMSFAIANSGLINNNNIGIENAKFKILYNTSLQQDSELNQLVIYNNLIAQRYSTITIVLFLSGIFLLIVSLFLWSGCYIKKRRKKQIITRNKNVMNMDKKYELLKIKYENARTWLFTLLVIFISTSIGYYTINNVEFKQKLAQINWILLLGVLFFDLLQIYRYSKICNYLKNENY